MNTDDTDEQLWTINVVVSLAPDDDDEFEKWCDAQGFYVLASGRRAWCDEFSSYLRGARGVATTATGERFLIYDEDHDPNYKGTS